MRTTSNRFVPQGSTALKDPRTRWDPRVWHRKVSRPVSVWMGVFILVGLVHTLLPEPRLVLIHIFTLGILTNAIMVWSQNLTERFLQAKLPDSARRYQLARSRLLNIGVAAVLLGHLFGGEDWNWIITGCGAAFVVGAVGWHAVSVGKQVAASDPAKRFRPVVWGYVVSSGSLVIGACFGAALAMDLRNGWQQRVLLAHLLANIGGFVGFAAMSSLVVLLPAMWRMKAVLAHQRSVLCIMGAGLLVAAAGTLSGSGVVLGSGVIIYAAAWAWALQTWCAGVFSSATRDRFTYPGMSALLAVVWLVAALVSFGTSALLIDGPLDALVPPTLPLLAGFAAQLLIGTMSYLMPTTIGGGPAATQAGLAELNRAGIFRAAAFNCAVLGWLFSPTSLARIVCSLVACGCLVAFLPLMVRAVRAQRRVIAAQSGGRV